MKISIINEKNLGEVLGEVDILSTTNLSEEIRGNLWSPTIFQGTRRVIAEATSTALFVVDVDAGCSLAEAELIFQDYKHIIGTSRNHQKPKHGITCDRFRVVLFLDKPIVSDQEFKTAFADAQSRWPFIDPACKDISRFYYPCTEIISVAEEGLTFKPDTSKIKEPPGEPLALNLPSDTSPPSTAKGSLSRSTLELLVFGEKVGSRHAALVKALKDMKEQQYSEAEALDIIERTVANVDSDFVDKSSLATIKDIYSREVKYDPRVIESGATAAPVYTAASELLNETFEYLTNKDKVTGDPTGIEGLDKMLGGGFREGELTVLMAQAKTGKNTLYHYLIHTMLKRGTKIGYASRELDPATEVIPNLLTIELKKNLWKEEIGDAIRVRSKTTLESWPLFFAPGYGYFSSTALREWISTLANLGVKHFWIDHFHYMLSDEDYSAVSKFIKEIKTLTKEFKVHINLIVQPKNLMMGQQLSMDTLKGGSSINQALDNLLILERVKSEKYVSRLKLEVARHKLASPGEIFLQYDPTTTSFNEVDSLLVDVTPDPIPINKPKYPQVAKPKTYP